MNGSVFTAVLNSIQEYFKKRTPITLYIPVVAFVGASFLVFIAAFGFEAPLAFWLQLSSELKAILVAAVVFTVLFLVYLMSHLRIVITQLYQGLWPQLLDIWPVRKITDWRRRVYLGKWRALTEQYAYLWNKEQELEKLEQYHQLSTSKQIPVPNRDLPIYHLISPGDLKDNPYPEVEKDWVTHRSALVGCYTLKALAGGKPITSKQIRSGPWPGYLEGKSVVSVPLVPYAVMGTKDNVKTGDLIHIILTPRPVNSRIRASKPGRFRTQTRRPFKSRAPEVFHNVLVLGVESAKEVLPADSDSSITRDLAVLVVALDTDEQPRFAELLATCDISIVRAVDALNHWVEGRLPRFLSLANQGVTYKLPLGGVKVGDVVDINGIKKANGKALVLKGCFVYTAGRQELMVAAPAKEAAAYDSGSQSAKVTITHARLTDVPFLKQDVKKEKVLVEGDLYLRDVSISELPAGAVTTKDELVNRRAVTALAAGSCIREDQVEKVAWLGGELDHTRHPEELPVGDNVSGADTVKRGHVIDIEITKTTTDGTRQLELTVGRNVHGAGDKRAGQVINIAMRKGVLETLPVGDNVTGADEIRVGQAIKIVMSARVGPDPCTFDGCLLCTVRTDEHGNPTELIVAIPDRRIERDTPRWPSRDEVASYDISLMPDDADAVRIFTNCLLCEVKSREDPKVLVLSIPDDQVTNWPGGAEISKYDIAVTEGGLFRKCFVYDVENDQHRNPKKLVVAIPNGASYPTNPTLYEIRVEAITKKIPVLRHNVLDGDLINATNVIKKPYNVGEVPAGAACTRADVDWHYAKEQLRREEQILKSQVDAIPWLAADRVQEKTLTVGPKVIGADKVKAGQVISVEISKMTSGRKKKELPVGPNVGGADEVKEGQVINIAVGDGDREALRVGPKVIGAGEVRVGQVINIAVSETTDGPNETIFLNCFVYDVATEKDGTNVLCVAIPRDRLQDWSKLKKKISKYRIIVTPGNANTVFRLSNCLLREVKTKPDGGKVLAVAIPDDQLKMWSIIENQIRSYYPSAVTPVDTIFEPCFVRKVECKSGSKQLTLAVPKELDWPPDGGQYEVTSIRRAGFHFKERLKPLSDRLYTQRKEMDTFMTGLFADRWPELTLDPLRDLAKDMVDLRQDLERFDIQWPRVVKDLEVTDLEEELGHLEYNYLGIYGLKDLRRDLKQAVASRGELLDKEIKLYFPAGHEAEVMPTALGNILKAVERYPYDNYGIEADLIWPRLKDALQGEITDALAESKNKLDMLLLMSFLSWVFWLPGSFVLALFSDTWLAFLTCFWGAPILAWLCYKAAIQYALDYGENLKSVYDLHRWDLLKKFNLDLPKELTLEDEKKIWDEINVLVERRTGETALKGRKYKIAS